MSSFSPNTNHVWRVGPGDFGPDQVLPGSGNTLYYLLDQVITEMTNGLWTLVLNEGSPTQQVYRFKINASGIGSNDLVLPTITFPTDDAADISTTPSFTWILPHPVGAVEVSLGLANSDFAMLSPNAIGWSRSTPFNLGETEFSLVTKTNGAGKIFIGTPTNAANQTLAGWTSSSRFNANRSIQFFVGPRPPASSLIAHLKCDVDGFFGKDSSGLVNNAGTDWIGARPSLDPNGIDGNAVHFIAADRAELPWEQDFVAKLSRGFTVSAWVKTTQNFGPDDGDWGAGAGVVAAQACCDGRDFAPLVLNGGRVLFNTGDGEGSGQTLASSGLVNTGAWVHLVATREASSGLMSLYINGRLDGTLQPALNAVLDAPTRLTVGSLGFFNHSFDGSIDDVQIYTNALTTEDVLYLYQHPGQTVLGLGGLSLGDAVDAPQFTWITGGDANWRGQTTNTFDNVDAAQSGIIGDDENSWIETTITGPGRLEFHWRVSSEGGADYFKFDTDGNFITDLTGDSGWVTGRHEVPPGPHTYRWTYYKDNSSAEGFDAAWLDTVTFTPGQAPIITVQPFDQTNYTGYGVALQAEAIGTPPPTWQWHKVGTGPIAGATNALYTPTNAGTASVAGSYFAVASNGSGSTSTRTAVVTFVSAALPPDWSAAFPAPLNEDTLLEARTNYGIACLVDATGICTRRILSAGPIPSARTSSSPAPAASAPR